MASPASCVVLNPPLLVPFLDISPSLSTLFNMFLYITSVFFMIFSLLCAANAAPAIAARATNSGEGKFRLIYFVRG